MTARERILQAGILRALDEFEDGAVDEAVDTLLAALEENDAHREGVRCPVCGHGAEWPGLLWMHVCRGGLEEAA